MQLAKEAATAKAEIKEEESEEEALSKALDAAFENLTGENLGSKLPEEEFNFGGDLEEKSQELEALTNGMITKAQDLDLDLSFLKDSSNYGNEDSEE